MNSIPLSIPDVLLIQPRIFKDERGFFLETYHAEKFAQLGITDVFVQDNHSGSRSGVLRGLHYQVKQPQGKLVRVLFGEIFDVAVDLRKSSPTFGKWVGQALSSDDKSMLWIPAGFAHGFYVLSDWADVSYKVTSLYAPTYERTLLWNDPTVGVDWPLLNNSLPNLSPKDMQGALFADAEYFE